MSKEELFEMFHKGCLSATNNQRIWSLKYQFQRNVWDLPVAEGLLRLISSDNKHCIIFYPSIEHAKKSNRKSDVTIQITRNEYNELFKLYSDVNF